MNGLKNAKLPAKFGYVEVIDENGEHVYKATRETEEKLKQEAAVNAISTTVDELLGTESSSDLKVAAEMNRAIQLFAATLTEESTMMEIATIYPEYKVGHPYKTKDIFRYGTNSVGDPQLYQVLQDHTSAQEFPPETSSSLYKKVGVGDDGIPMWVQPLGATDAYALGDIVTHNGKKWKSQIANNVWEPGVYGWVEVSEETEDPDSGETIPEWVQPSNAQDAYKKGDVVMYNGKKYESLIDANTWSPEAYPAGWKLIET